MHNIDPDEGVVLTCRMPGFAVWRAVVNAMDELKHFKVECVRAYEAPDGNYADIRLRMRHMPNGV